MVKGWCSLTEMRTLERERVLRANDLLDALEEAEEENRREAEAAAKAPTGPKTRRRR